MLALAEKHAVRYLKVATCLNVGNVNGMGLWEGVPLREVIWLARAVANLRRVYYHGYNSDTSKPGPGSKFRCRSAGCSKTRPANNL